MKALYAGSFDPITNGHIDIIRQAVGQLKCVVIVGIAVNPDKSYLFSDNMRLSLVQNSLVETGLDGNCEAIFYRGLTVDAASQYGADILIRGLRAVSDFDAEFQMTLFNRRLKPGRRESPGSEVFHIGPVKGVSTRCSEAEWLRNQVWVAKTDPEPIYDSRRLWHNPAHKFSALQEWRHGVRSRSLVSGFGHEERRQESGDVELRH